MESITIHFTYLESDYQEFLRNYFWKNRSRLYLFLGVLAFAFLVLLQRESFSTSTFWVSILLPLGLMVGLWWFVLQYSGRRTFRMAPQMSEARTCVIDQEKLDITGQTFKSEFRWSGVQQVVETARLVLIYNSKVSAVMLPKRAFSPEQFSNFKSLVENTSGLSAKWKSK